MTPRTVWRLYGALMLGTVITAIFAWLPLVRIVGRADGYEWGVLGLSGSGTDGPFWVFIVATLYVVAMLFTLVRGPRRLSYLLVVPWHLLVTGIVLAGVVQGGADATIQGQGLRWEIPLWVLVLPFGALAGVAVAWVWGDRRTGATPVAPPWSSRNTAWLAASGGLLVVALVLFRAGTNYDLVTAAAIIATIAHWIALVRSFGNVAGPRLDDPAPGARSPA